MVLNLLLPVPYCSDEVILGLSGLSVVLPVHQVTKEQLEPAVKILSSASICGKKPTSWIC